MALEDFAMFRTIPGSVCFYPSDAVSAERAIELAANYRGLTFTRTSRPATPVVYKNDEVFEIGKSKVWWSFNIVCLYKPAHIFNVCVCVCVCRLFVSLGVTR